MEAELMLHKAKRLICQCETVKEQQEVLKPPIKEETSLDLVVEIVASRRKLPGILTAISVLGFELL